MRSRATPVVYVHRSKEQKPTDSDWYIKWGFLWVCLSLSEPQVSVCNLRDCS